ncbi:hypothetical protein ACWIG2_13285 [Streptomyces cellulosae]
MKVDAVFSSSADKPLSALASAFSIGIGARVAAVQRRGQDRERDVASGIVRTVDHRHVVGSEDERAQAERAPLPWSDVDLPGGPLGRPPVGADDEEYRRNAVLGVHVGEVVGPTGRLVRGRPALGLDRQEETAVLGVHLQERFHPAFQGLGLREIRGEFYGGDGRREGDAEVSGGAGEEPRVLLEDPMQGLVG